MSGGGAAVGTGNTTYDHVITLCGSEVYRDGRKVRIKVDRHTKDITIGCTKFTRDALLRIVEITKPWEQDEYIVQEGA